MTQNPIDELESYGYPSSKLERHTASLLAENFFAASLAFDGKLSDFAQSAQVFVTHTELYPADEVQALDMRIILLLTLNELLQMPIKRRSQILNVRRLDLLDAMNVFALDNFEDYFNFTARSV